MNGQVTNKTDDGYFPDGVFKTEVVLNDDVGGNRSARLNNSGKSSSLDRRILRAEDVEVSFARTPTPQPLPPNVNLEAIIMNVLREAPFASGKAKIMWRKYLGSVEFQRMSTDAFWYILAHHLQSHPQDPDSPHFSRMSDNYVRLFFIVPPAYKDDFFTHFHEALACTALLCLISAFPKASKKYRSFEFKTLVMDLCGEWVLGLRQSCPPGDHWIHALDDDQKGRNQLAAELGGTLGGSTIQSQEKSQAFEFEGMHKNRTVGIRSKYTIQHSPMISTHLNKVSSRSTNTHLTLAVGLTENPVRPIRGYTGQDDKPAWKTQHAKWRTDLLVEPTNAISQSQQFRLDAMKNYQKSKKKALRDLDEIRHIGLEKKHHIQMKEKAVLGKGGDVHGFSNNIVQNQKVVRNRRR